MNGAVDPFKGAPRLLLHGMVSESEAETLAEQYFEDHNINADVWVDDPAAEPMTMVAEIEDGFEIDSLESRGSVIMDGATVGPWNDVVVHLVFWVETE